MTEGEGEERKTNEEKREVHKKGERGEVKVKTKIRSLYLSERRMRGEGGREEG